MNTNNPTSPAFVPANQPGLTTKIGAGNVNFADGGVIWHVEDQSGFPLGEFAVDFEIQGMKATETIVLQRIVEYTAPATGDPLPASATTLGMIQKNGKPFNLLNPIEVAALLALTDAAKFTADADGAFWVEDSKGNVVNPAITRAATSLTTGAYTFNFAVKNNGDWDALKGTADTPDLNVGNTVQPQIGKIKAKDNDDSSGCTVGTSANYDMALLLLAIMGVVAFRATRNRGRKA